MSGAFTGGGGGGVLDLVDGLWRIASGGQGSLARSARGPKVTVADDRQVIGDRRQCRCQRQVDVMGDRDKALLLVRVNRVRARVGVGLGDRPTQRAGVEVVVRVGD